MKSLFQPAVFSETLARIERLQADATRQWGTMTPAQMLEHSARALEMACGTVPHKQILLGKLVSWLARKDFLGEKPFGKDGPTSPLFKIAGEPDFSAARARLLDVMEDFQRKGERGVDGNVHAFFG